MVQCSYCCGEFRKLQVSLTECNKAVGSPKYFIECCGGLEGLELSGMPDTEERKKKIQIHPVLPSTLKFSCEKWKSFDDAIGVDRYTFKNCQYGKMCALTSFLIKKF